jgi:hypothetical protein
MYGVLKNNYTLYKKNIFLYFLFNTTFIFTLYLILNLTEYYSSTTFVFWILSILAMKSMDIIFKIFLFKKIDNNETLEQYLPIDINIGFMLRYFNVFIYPFMFIIAIY